MAQAGFPLGIGPTQAPMIAEFHGVLIANLLEFPFGHLTLSTPQVISGGVLSTDQVVRLSRNALVRSFPVVLQAGRANWIRALDVAEVRVTDVSGSSGSQPSQARTSVTLDFGGLRTVAAIGLASAASRSVIQVKQWTGMGFADQAVASASFATRITARTQTMDSFTGQPVVPFPSEVRTERLQIDIAGEFDDAQEAGESLRLLLPDLPADIAITIDGGPPVFQAPGPVRAGAEGWEADESGRGNTLLRQTVDLGEALTALLADPAADFGDEVELRLSLTARQPGVLILDVPDPEALVSADDIRFLTLVNVDPTGREVVFEEEGLRSVPVNLPPWVGRIEGIRLTYSGEFGEERIRPPLGPEFTPLAGGSTPRAEMILDPDRAAAVALGDVGAQESLVGVRLPLRAESTDAEVQVILLEAGAEGPGAPIPGRASDPVTVAGGDVDTWYTFRFPEPVPLDTETVPVAAIAVSRGSVAWALSTDEASTAVWHGSLEGPWQALPSAGGLSGLGGRIRTVTLGGPDVPPLPPVLLVVDPPGAVEGQALVALAEGLLPTRRPTTVEVAPAGSGAPEGASMTLVAQATGKLVVERIVAEVSTDDG